MFEDFASGVAFQDAGDLSHGFTFAEATRHVVAGGLVVAHPGDDDVEQRRVGLPVPAPVQPMPHCLARADGIGATPHRWAQAASERMRSGLSPAATNSLAAVSNPTP